MSSIIFLLIVIVGMAMDTIVQSHHIGPREEDLKEFPLPLTKTTYDTWAKDNIWVNTYTAYPTNTQDVVDAANWANYYSWQLRPSGRMHSWSPITVPLRTNQRVTHKGEKLRPINSIGSSSSDPKSRPTHPSGYWNLPKTTDGSHSGLILLKTEKMNKMGIISKEPGNFSFWAQPGILMEDLLKTLQKNGMGFAHHPAPGEISLGGVLAIGGHGAGILAKGEKKLPGHTYGSVSNLIMSFEAVVYKNKNGEDKDFSAKVFQRSDKEAKAFLVNLGRTFLTNITLRAGPLQYFRCQSYTNIPIKELFAKPGSKGRGRKRTFSSCLNKSGRAEVILFPFTTKPWLKVWTPIKMSRRTPWDMWFSRRVKRPYNYIFAENFSPQVSQKLQDLKNTQTGKVARAWSEAAYASNVVGLKVTDTYDIWGAGPDVMLYVKASTLRYHANGYAILSSREDVQRVLYESYSIYEKLIQKYEEKGKYPVNGALEVRVTGTDEAGDVMIAGAESPAISASTPLKDKPEWNTVTWFDVLTYTRTEFTCDFMADLEDEFRNVFGGKDIKNTSFVGNWSAMRVEWSKGHGYDRDNDRPWYNEKMLKFFIPLSYNKWEDFTNTIVKYDDDDYNGTVFNNLWLDYIVENYSTILAEYGGITNETIQ